LNNLETLYLKMSSNILDILSKRHTEWLNMAKSFKLDNNDANELVQNMYLRMYDYTKDVKRIMYNENEINTFYIYITLRNLYYSKFTNYKKKNKTILFSDIDKENFKYIINKMSYDIDDFEDNYKKKVNLEALCNKIDSVIEDWYWYDKKLTKLYLNTDMSMRDISKETKISLSSIFNTLTNAKEKIRKESKEEYKKYKS
jgi:DNA-directed RNA polymerase specialized sigma24 family protein